MDLLVGEKAIAAHLGVATEDTVRAWGALLRDPLPLRDFMGSVCAVPGYLDDWKARGDDLAAWRVRRPRGEPGLPIWVGWEEITAAFPVDRDIETVERAARLAYRPLPVIGVGEPTERLWRPGGPAQVWIYRSAHRDWIDACDKPHITGQTRAPRIDSAQMPLFG